MWLVSSVIAALRWNILDIHEGPDMSNYSEAYSFFATQPQIVFGAYSDRNVLNFKKICRFYAIRCFVFKVFSDKRNIYMSILEVEDWQQNIWEF